MAIGTVKFFNPGKGFGFITPDSGAKDVFVPSASIATAGVALLKTGQRVSFEEMPDAKGPKAVNLKLLESPPKPVVENRPAPQSSAKADNSRVTLYCDPSQEESEDILDGLRDAGLEPLVVDYIAAAPTRDQLKTLSSLLRGTDQSLVRRYHPLFHELRLDDRFISENDFWDAIVEHPALINGPVVALGGRAAICRSPEALKEFLAPSNGRDAQRKSLSPGLLKLMGRLPAPQSDAVETRTETKPAAEKPSAAKPQAKAKAVARPEAKAAPKPKPAAKAKAAPKAKPVKKKPAAKPRRG